MLNVGVTIVLDYLRGQFCAAAGFNDAVERILGTGGRSWGSLGSRDC